MEENPLPPIQARPISQTNPIIPEEVSGKTFKFSDFLLGLFFGLGGAIILALFDLLLIAFVNPEYKVILNIFIGMGPALVFIFYFIFLVHFFKNRRGAFWGLILSFFVFVALAAVLIKFILI